ncbi:MAG TPA: SDR family oxidoreductase [Casimicrobiaceae bacterium]|nr:SDR family oxidoreductase [Casimicrobiaceae bacterium]
MNGSFRERIAWITGAGGALGAAIAETLAAEGAVTYLSGRQQERLASTAERVDRQQRGAARILRMDMAVRHEVDAATERIVQEAGRIDFLVNCTALPIFGAFLELSDEDWEQVVQAKYLGYVRTLRAAIPHMVRQQFGRIVNISGRGGRQPTPAHLPGSSVNAAVNLLTKGLADIYGKDNIRINAVAPGPIDTPRMSKIASTNETLAQQGQTGARAANAPTPLRRLGTPQEIADAVAFLLSERSAYITGTILSVDGGGTAAV